MGDQSVLVSICGKVIPEELECHGTGTSWNEYGLGWPQPQPLEAGLWFPARDGGWVATVKAPKPKS